MIGRLAVVIIAIFMLAFTFITLVIWNNAMYNPEGGLDQQLNEQAQEDMSDQYYQHYSEQRESTRWHFGVTGVLIMGVIFLIIIVTIFKGRKKPGV